MPDAAFTGTITAISISEDGNEMYTVVGEPPPDPNQMVFHVVHDRQSKLVVKGTSVTTHYDDAVPEPRPAKLIKSP